MSGVRIFSRTYEGLFIQSLFFCASQFNDYIKGTADNKMNEIAMERKKRIDFLDYLKAVCVIMVIITHYDWDDKSSPFFTMLINMAVPVFMIISGYNFAMSNRKKTGGEFEKMYAWKIMKPKLIRFLVPFFTVCLIEILMLLLADKNIHPFRIFLLGAYGPGSY